MREKYKQRRLTSTMIRLTSIALELSRKLTASRSLLLAALLLASHDKFCAAVDVAGAAEQGQGQEESCGAYRGARCGDIWMSQVLGEKGLTFAIKMCVAAALGMFIGIQREFGLATLLHISSTSPVSQTAGDTLRSCLRKSYISCSITVSR